VPVPPPPGKVDMMTKVKIIDYQYLLKWRNTKGLVCRLSFASPFGRNQYIIDHEQEIVKGDCYRVLPGGNLEYQYSFNGRGI
jgi:hypothetical protein